jgi:hypothetical protein
MVIGSEQLVDGKAINATANADTHPLMERKARRAAR